MATRNLTPKQERFIAFYLGEAQGNATRAAHLAGYKTPHPSGSLLLRNATVAAAIEAERTRVRTEGITNRDNRVAAYNDRWRRMQQVIAERAEDRTLAGIPGGSTGLLVRQWKRIGPGADAETVEEFAVDTGLLREMRELEKQGAVEAGQWQERRDGEPPSTTINLNVSATAQAATVTYDSFGRAFARLTGVGDPGADSSAEPVDTAAADRPAGRLPGAARP